LKTQLPRTPSLTALLVIVIALAFAPGQARANPLDVSRQLVLVLADTWESRRGEMRLYERAPGGVWKRRGGAVEVELGKNGLGWGLGLHGEPGDGPVKREGDGKAPAGIFRISGAFGYAPARKLEVPYMHASDTAVCVDDAKSSRYNSAFDSSSVPGRDWKSAEDMRRKDRQYELGLFVDHNSQPAVPGAGSCIFMHVREGKGKYTSGCTAMTLKEMERLASWLEASKNPVLVQIPRAERSRFTSLYGTP